MTRKVWDDAAGKLVKREPQPDLPMFDPVAPPAELGEYDLTKPCRICNANPGEQCASIVNASHTRDIPHHTRRRAA
jgi:hypothetical protein